MSTEVTIIGSGMAGVAAAVEALSRGARVTMVRGRPGATTLSSGAWDIAGDLLRVPGDPLTEVRPAAVTLPELIRRRPYHPYNIMMQNPVIEEGALFLSQAVERIAASLQIRLQGSLQKRFIALTPLGTPRPTSFAVRGTANVVEMPGARPLVVGLKGLSSFSAPLTASFLKKIFGATQVAEVSLATLPAVLGSIDTAGRLDDDKPIQELAKKLADAVKQTQPTHLILPPVIGLDRHDHLLSLLYEATGLPCLETLSLVPSIPGLRLQREIEKFLERGGIHLIDGDVVGCEKNGRRVERLKIRNQKGEETLPVDRIIIATGRYLGGGIIKEREFHQPIFGLPVFINNTPVKKVFIGKVVGRSFFDDHPLFSAGLRVTRNFQPVDENGRLACENLWAGGRVIAGSNPSVEQCGMGVSIGTGTLAGRLSIQ